MFLVIRQATAHDLPEILDIYNDAILHTTAVYTYQPVTLEERQRWFDQKQQQQLPVFVFEEAGQVAGFATYGSFRDWPAYLYTIEHSIYVSPHFQGQGIASQLLDTLINYAKDHHYQTIVAGIDAHNAASIALHEKFGFTHAGTLSKVGYKFDQWLDLAFYQLQLK